MFHPRLHFQEDNHQNGVAGNEETAIAAALHMKVKNAKSDCAMSCAQDELLTSIEGADMGEHIHPEKYRLKD